ncbi:hypothetical protein TSMEX_001406, partial [Taenia solium]
MHYFNYLREKRGTGIGFVAVGLFILLCSLVTTCCAFQFGAAGRFIKSINKDEQRQTIVDQPP